MLFDLPGTFLSLLSTYYYIKMDKKAWAFTFIATCVNGGLYWYKGLWANSFLEIFYFFNACYGWYYWQQHDKKSLFKLGHYSLSKYLNLLILFFLIFSIIGIFLKTQTHSDVILLDTLTTSLSVIAQWLMCQKIILTWVVWFFTDALFAYMYYIKGLPFHCLELLFFTGLAVAGYIRWSKLAKNQPSQQHCRS